MSTENEFIEVMKNRSDSELLEIVTKFKEKYQVEAVKAAESELKSRNLTTENLDSAKQEIDKKTKESDNLNIENKKNGSSVWLIFSGIIFGVLAFLSLIPIMFSAMLFDSPGSANNGGAKFFVLNLDSFPIVVLFSIIKAGK